MAGDFDQVPAELRARDQWVCWRREARKGRDTKVPVSPTTGRPARTNDPTSWSSFEVAEKAQGRLGADGIGFMFTSIDPICGIDLDKALDAAGRPKAWAQEILDLLPAGAYVEISPSGQGLHVILLGFKPESKFRTPIADGCLEVYDRDRYFTVSGRCFSSPGSALIDGQAAIDQICSRFLGGAGSGLRSAAAPEEAITSLPSADQRLLQKAFASKSGPKIHTLWSGDSSGHASRSEADLALCSHLCHWTRGDLDRVDRLFRCSGLMRPKWERGDYRDSTLAKAAEMRDSPPKPGRAAPEGSAVIPRPAQAPHGAEAKAASHVEKSGLIEMTHLGNARRLAAQCGDALRFVAGLGFFVYEGGFWQNSKTKAEGLAARLGRFICDEATQASSCASETADLELRRSYVRKAHQLSAWALKSEQGPTIRESLNLAAPLLDLSPVELDSDPFLLNVQNGTLALNTGSFHKHKAKYFLTRIAPSRFERDATAPRWAAFIDEIMGGSPDKVRYLQKALGYSATGQVGEQCLFICYGTGQNGKSTLLEVIGQVLGPGYVSRAAPDLLMAQRGNVHPSSVADLRGARIAVCQEVGTAKAFDAQRLKEMTGERTLKARVMYGEWFEFAVRFKIWLVVNELPRVTDDTPAFWRRIRVIRFENTIGRPVRDFDRRLLEESSGILNWLLEGALLYFAEGLTPPEEVTRAGLEYRQEVDTVARFVAECCKIGEKFEAKASDLQRSYEAFAGEHNFQPVSWNHFGPALESQGFLRRPRRRDGYFYAGLRLWSEASPPDRLHRGGGV